MDFLYNIFVQLLIFGMKIGSIFNAKLRKGLVGRVESVAIVKQKFRRDDKVIWMHAASLGEYEQGIPVLEKLKEKFPTHKILITFFSPSGYENVILKKNIADAVCYLPFDLKACVEDFTSQFQTMIFFTVKYDYWYHLLANLKKNDAQVYVISALFYRKQVFFKSYGSFFRAQLQKNIDWFFHQTKESFDLAQSINLSKSSIAGDTRFDRVKQIQNRDPFVEFIDEFKKNQPTIVVGSSWEAEEKIAEILAHNLPDVKIIIAPHDLKRIPAILNKFHTALLYSQVADSQLPMDFNYQILLIDGIGLLSKIYSYADLAVVGGGFHAAGLHNILEAATFGVPVIFGNKYQKNPEADGLLSAMGGKSFGDEKEAATYILKLMKDDLKMKEMSQNAKHFIDAQPNASEIILKKMLS